MRPTNLESYHSKNHCLNVYDVSRVFTTSNKNYGITSHGNQVLHSTTPKQRSLILLHSSLCSDWARMSASGFVPLDVRRKLQVLLLIRHGSLGRDVSCVHDDYKVYYKEFIEPGMYNFRDWETLLKSIPEVEVKRSKRCKIVSAKLVTHEFALELLSRLFPSEDPSDGVTDQVMGISPEPDFSVDSFVDNLLADNATAVDGGQSADRNFQAGENRQENVTSSCPDFPVTFERISKVEVSSLVSPFLPGQSVVAAADSGSPSSHEGEDDHDEEIIPSTLDVSSELLNGGNTEGTSGEESLRGKVMSVVNSDSQAYGERDEIETIADSVKEDTPAAFVQEECDDDIQVVYEAITTLPTSQSTPTVPVMKRSPFDVIPRKCTFRPHRKGSSRISAGNNNGVTLERLNFKADVMCNKNLVNVNNHTATAQLQAQPCERTNEEEMVKVEVKEEIIKVEVKKEIVNVEVKTECSNDEQSVRATVSQPKKSESEELKVQSIKADQLYTPAVNGAHYQSHSSPTGINDDNQNTVGAGEPPALDSFCRTRTSVCEVQDPVEIEGCYPKYINVTPATVPDELPEINSVIIDVASLGDSVEAPKNITIFPEDTPPPLDVPEKNSKVINKTPDPDEISETAKIPGITAEALDLVVAPVDVPMGASVSTCCPSDIPEKNGGRSSSSDCTSDTTSHLSDSSSNSSFSDYDFWGPSNSNIARLSKRKNGRNDHFMEESVQKKTEGNSDELGIDNSSKHINNTIIRTQLPKSNLPLKRPVETPPAASSVGRKRQKRVTPGASTLKGTCRSTVANNSLTEMAWFKRDTTKSVHARFVDYFAIIEHNRVSAEPYLDREASNEFVEVEGYGYNVHAKQISEMRNNKNPNILCFHPFWSLTPQCKKTSFANLWKSDEIPKLSYDAIQLLNVDADTNYSLSSQETNFQLNFVSSYGKFEEYFIWRNGSKYKGFGLMPTGSSTDETTRSPDLYYNNFLPFAGTCQVNIMEPSTRIEFTEFVQSNLPSCCSGLDIFVANGIGDPSVKHRPQDICLTQFLLALTLLREGGNFILKVEDTLTCFGVNLLFLMSRCFVEIAIHKPLSAFPGERFIICKSRLHAGEVETVRKFLERCYNRVVEVRWSNGIGEITRLFALNAKDFFECHDSDFLDYVKMRNNTVATTEWDEWDRFKTKAKLVTSKTHKESLLLDLAAERNQIWKIWSSNSKPEIYWKSVFGNSDAGIILDRSEKSVMTAVKRFNSPLGHMNQWKFVPSSGSNNRFIISACEDVVYKYQDKSWKIIPHLQLTKGTVLYGELIQSASTSRVLNIIDAAMIGLEDIRHLSFSERRDYCVSFANDMDTPVNLEYRVICADLINLRELNSFLAEVADAKEKGKFIFRNSGNQLMDSVTNKNTLVEFRAVEVLLLKTRRAPVEEYADDAGSSNVGTGDFGFLMRNRLFWEWNPRSDLNVMATDMCSEFAEDFATALVEYLAEHAKN
ncbi:unnamed protein product [Allacma fusca]|uniref:Cap-specific mRNA (nucleoside-2'-O-)-methyltransferase 1 n=1 Tax=Allacma fusca TaxID=39272 RepID=A0A8J2LDM3_9HEXA|nr:unnamed protein product [Allacma fusca]